jgi:hypothetical protein
MVDVDGETARPSERADNGAYSVTCDPTAISTEPLRTLRTPREHVENAVARQRRYRLNESPLSDPGVFAEYQHVLDDVTFEARELGEMASVSYDTGYLKDVGALAKMLGSESVRVFGASETPSLITFPECPFAVIVLMPLRHTETRLGVGVAKVMSGAVDGTIAALKAHQKRWANKL